jgi:hypothetical protein
MLAVRCSPAFLVVLRPSGLITGFFGVKRKEAFSLIKILAQPATGLNSRNKWLALRTPELSCSIRIQRKFAIRNFKLRINGSNRSRRETSRFQGRSAV